MDRKRYKLVGGERRDDSSNQSIWLTISYFGILTLICIISFLVAKYIVRSSIDGDKIPIDTSERL